MKPSIDVCHYATYTIDEDDAEIGRFNRLVALLPLCIATLMTTVSYQNATKMSATTSKAVKKANTIQYIIHFT